MSKYHYHAENIGSANALDATLQPDTILPEQWADTRRSTERTPEKQLWLAILQSAIEDLGKGPGVNDRQFQRWAQTRLWIKDDDDSLASFVFCCQVVGIDPESLRKAVLDAAKPITFTRRTPVDSGVQPKKWRER